MNAGDCASCGCTVNAKVGVVPFHVDGESFCPTCFVYVRAAREPNRFIAGQYIPIHCHGCGLKSVSVGVASCMQCRGKSGRVLLPVPKVV